MILEKMRWWLLLLLLWAWIVALVSMDFYVVTFPVPFLTLPVLHAENARDPAGPQALPGK